MDWSIPSLGVSYWAFIATFYLLWLTWQDYRHKMRVDDRKNWFMFGITTSLLTHIPRPIWYILLVVVLGIGIRVFYARFRVFGEGDINSFAWIFTGLGFINPFKLIFFLLYFVLLTGLYFVLKKYVFKRSEPTPFYGVILLAFVSAAWFMGLY